MVKAPPALLTNYDFWLRLDSVLDNMIVKVREEIDNHMTGDKDQEQQGHDVQALPGTDDQGQTQNTSNGIGPHRLHFLRHSK